MFKTGAGGAIVTLYRGLHAASFFLLSGLALAAIGYTVLCAAGVLPWLQATVTVGETAYEGAGRVIQYGLTLVLAALFFFMPSASRLMHLERSHRDFRLTMDDVARAYHAAHAGDRAGMFTLSSEFDAVRERIAFLREHPDLQSLEPEVIELAAQMSHQSRDLAQVYSVEKVERAREFLRQRHQEAERQQAQIVEALHLTQEVRQWRDQVEIEESIAASQLDRLAEQMSELLPDLGFELRRNTSANGAANVVNLENKPAAE